MFKNTPIKLIVGLGNIGAEYSMTRHNAGFMLLDELAGQSFVIDRKLHGETTRINIQNNEVRLLKPYTLMNASGRSVVAAALYYKIRPEEILVIHDELDLPCGVARFKFGGGHGGHNGLRDIQSNLGTQNYWRLRLGIGHPGHKSQVSHYVLHRASKPEQASIDEAIIHSIEVLPLAIIGNFTEAMHVLHTSKK